MFDSDFADDPAITELRQLMAACQFVEVVGRTADLGPEPAIATDRARWRMLLLLRLAALVVLMRYPEAEVTCRQALRSAEADGDLPARARILGYGLTTAYFLGRIEEAVTLLDEVLAAAEEMPQGPGRMSTLTAAAIGAGMIGLTDLSDELLSQLVDQVLAAPHGVIPAGVVMFVHALLTTRRCQLALELEQRGQAKYTDLYRSVLTLASDIGVDVLDGAVINSSLADRPANLYLAHLCFAKITIGEGAEIEEMVRSATAGATTATFDSVSATTEIMWGLSQLRVDLQGDEIDLAHCDALARHLIGLADQTRTPVLQAETARVFLEVALRNGDSVLRAAARERYEAALEQLDWMTRLERAQFTGLRSQTMRAIVRDFLG
ncbi:hypothetical protein ACIRG5_47285 [Lentzea sp. NPDC102401]|uniref:hypothetical protein n=1 Tax=Lentzea sp. NPDC102401 TaxID=3364128 RepID=UPI0037FB4A3A